MKQYFELTIHTIVVALFLFLLNYPNFDLTFGLFRSGDLTLLWPSMVGMLFNAVLFYGITLRLIPNTLRKKGTWKFLLFLFILFSAVTFLKIITDSLFAKSIYGTLNADHWEEITVMVLFANVMTLIIALAYGFVKDWIANEQIRRSINEWKLLSELDLLKSQINPHFLFNALNTLFSMALQSKDEKTAEGISKLSEMMRYVLDRSGSKTVPLEDEIKYIEDYIHMQLLRFGDKVAVTFEYPKTMKNLHIAPMLLIPFVENAFKYGVSSKENTSIHISISEQENNIDFSIKNRIVERTESIHSSGIGMNNVRKRLEITYPDSHSLVVKERDNMFEVKLNLNIQ